MYLRREIKKFKEPYKKAVSFCKNCDSQNIEIIKTCMDCGSHDISSDYLDKRAEKQEYVDKDVFIFSCDCCDKEFYKLDKSKSKYISYLYGEFVPFYSDEAEKYYELTDDLCEDCLKLVVDKLNKQLDDIALEDNIYNTIKNISSNNEN